MTTSEGYFTTSGNTSEDLPNRTMAYGKKERGHIAPSDASSLSLPQWKTRTCADYFWAFRRA